MASRKTKATWSSVKAKLTELDREGFVLLVRDLYADSKENQNFLHTRFGLGEDILKPYKASISKWVCPDVINSQDISVSKAEKAISDYQKALGLPEGIAELTVYYCEACSDFLCDCGMEDDDYFSALVLMFEQALLAIRNLESNQKNAFINRLERVQAKGQNWGWGVGDEMNALMAEHSIGKE